MTQRSLLDKQAVARAFSNAANGYDRIANIQQKTGGHLLSLIDACGVKLKAGSRCLDLGAGTGRETRQLAKQLQPDMLVALDIAPGMCQSVSNRLSCHTLQADFDSLPIVDNSMDLIFANLALQWSDDLPKLLGNLRAVLSANGVIAFNTLLQGSMQEIDAAWADLDDAEHTLDFARRDDIENQLSSFFRIEKITVDRFVDTHETIEETLQSLRGIGASNHLSDRPKRTLTKMRYRRFLSALEQKTLVRDIGHERAGEYGLTYNVLSAVCSKA